MADLSDSLTQVRLRNYKSIAACDLEVGSLVILVGPNGAGKSNLLDALRFVADALRGSLAGVIEERGGFREIRHRGKTVARSLAVVLGFRLSAGEGWYGFRLERRGDGYVVAKEHCRVETEHKTRSFSVVEGEVEEGPEPGLRPTLRSSTSPEWGASAPSMPCTSIFPEWPSAIPTWTAFAACSPRTDDCSGETAAIWPVSFGESTRRHRSGKRRSTATFMPWFHSS